MAQAREEVSDALDHVQKQDVHNPCNCQRSERKGRKTTGEITDMGRSRNNRRRNSCDEQDKVDNEGDGPAITEVADRVTPPAPAREISVRQRQRPVWMKDYETGVSGLFVTEEDEEILKFLGGSEDPASLENAITHDIWRKAIGAETSLIEEMKHDEVEMNQRFEEMDKEIEEYEEERKALESISTRAVELETEVSNLQDDLINSVAEVDKTAEEVAELKKALAEKVEKLEGYEKEAEGLRKDRAEVEKRVSDLERKIGVLEVREMEEKSKKLRLEEAMREKADEKEREIEELQKKVSVLNLEFVKNGEELAKCKSVKKLTEVALSESQKREKEMELKKNELLKTVEEGNKTIFELKERTMKPSNGVRDNTKGSMEAEFQWPVVAAGSVGAAGLVAATLFVCYSKLR